MISDEDLTILDVLVKDACGRGGGTFQAGLWDKLKAERSALIKLIELSTEIDNEDPGCGACAELHDAKLVAEKGKEAEWGDFKHAYWQYKQNRQNEVVEQFNKLYTELGL